jgi:hypothetical protein
MNVSGLLECLEFQIDVQELRTLGLTKEEIEGFIQFEWDSSIGADLITSLMERSADDQH